MQHKEWLSQVPKFASIGALGFLVDAGVLSWLVSVKDWGLVSARLVSFAFAVSATWYLNRRITFSEQASVTKSKEYGRYIVSQSIGALINFGVYVLVVNAIQDQNTWPIVPLAIGSGFAVIFNFFMARTFIFRG